MNWKQAPKISVIGGASPSPQSYDLAYEVGRELGKAGAVLICGGLSGVMEASCRGAKETGGLTIGILSGTDRHSANQYIDIPIVTGLGDARNVLVACSGEAVIAVDGSLGTLSEITFALKRNVPVVGLNTWKLDPDFMVGTNIIYTKTPQEAVKLAIELRRI